MQKFEFDHKSGMMMLKKNDSIYFAASQGGGLRVDDHKNNIKYIIERDGSITNLFGVIGASLNLYDMRDARMIADRVVRMFGKDHSFADYHCFLKGYRMSENLVKTYDEYIDESMWADAHKKNIGIEVRSEVGKLICRLEDGTKLIMPNDEHPEGELVEFDGEPYLKFKYWEDCYMVCYYDKNSRTDTFYIYDDEAEIHDANLVKGFEVDSKLRWDNFCPLIAVLSNANWTRDDLYGMETYYDDNTEKYEFTSGNEEWWVFTDEKKLDSYAIDYEKDFLESGMKFDKGTIENFLNYYGDKWIEDNYFEDALRESYEFQFDDMNDEEKIDALLDREIIQDNEDFFELDEDGNPDHDLPTFNPDNYKNDWVDEMMDGINDYVDEYFSSYGVDGIEDHIDFDKLAECIINDEGRGMIAGYDNKERQEYLEGNDYFVFRIN